MCVRQGQILRSGGGPPQPPQVPLVLFAFAMAARKVPTYAGTSAPRRTLSRQPRNRLAPRGAHEAIPHPRSCAILGRCLPMLGPTARMRRASPESSQASFRNYLRDLILAHVLPISPHTMKPLFQPLLAYFRCSAASGPLLAPRRRNPPRYRGVLLNVLLGAKSGRSRLTSTQLWPKSDKLWPNLVAIGQRSANTRKDLAGLGPELANMSAQTWPSPGKPQNNTSGHGLCAEHLETSPGRCVSDRVRSPPPHR